MKFSFCLAFLGVASALHLRPNKPSEQTPEQRRAAVTTAAPIAKPEPIFYMTAMNKLANKHQTRLWLSSVRQTGKWKGEIVIVTDKPDCLAKNLGAKLLGGDKLSSTEVMDVFPGGDGMGKIYMMKQETTSNVKVMKQQKALAWINMRKVGLTPSFILYTDQDIVIGTDVNEFIAEAKKLQNDAPLLAVFRDQGVTKGQLHTGIMVIFKGQETEQCLDDWGKKILTTKSSKYKGFAKENGDAEISEEAGAEIEAEMMGPDQRALMGTASCKKGKDKKGKDITVMDPSFLTMPTAGSLKSGKTATFIHFTNTNRWKHIKPKDMETFFKDTLHLPEMQWFEYEEC